jgi:hypothetical protein
VEAAALSLQAVRALNLLAGRVLRGEERCRKEVRREAISPLQARLVLGRFWLVVPEIRWTGTMIWQQTSADPLSESSSSSISETSPVYRRFFQWPDNLIQAMAHRRLLLRRQQELL